jgi:transposase-like protein
VEIMNCPHCGKPFGYSEIGGSMWGAREPEEITCPHCNETAAMRRSGGYFESRVLNDEQLNKWKANKV